MQNIISFQTAGRKSNSENVTKDAMNWPNQANKIEEENETELREKVSKQREEIVQLINIKIRSDAEIKFLERVLQSIDSYLNGVSGEDDIIYLLIYYLNYDYDDLDISIDGDCFNVRSYPDVVSGNAMMFILKHAKDWIRNEMMTDFFKTVLRD